jgi:hypothetical protein
MLDLLALEDRLDLLALQDRLDLLALQDRLDRLALQERLVLSALQERLVLSALQERLDRPDHKDRQGHRHCSAPAQCGQHRAKPPPAVWWAKSC